MSPSDSESLRFGVFEISPGTGELRKNGRLLAVRPQPFKVLSVLVSRPGELVTREELQRSLWHEQEIVDFEQGLNHCVREIRTVLGDSADSPRFVQTLPRRGYRFLAEVHRWAGPARHTLEPISVSIEPAPPIDSGVRNADPPPRSRRGLAAVLAAIGILGVIGIGLRVQRLAAPPAPSPMAAPTSSRLLVLPFAVIPASSTSSRLLADGLTEELIGRIGLIAPGRIVVLGLTSSMAYREARPELAVLHRDLRVDYVLEGVVRHEAAATRVSASLVRVPDGARIWTVSEDEGGDDLLRFQGSLARKVARAIDATVALPAPEATTATRSTAAYAEYLRGRALLAQRDPGSMRRGLTILQEVTRLEPESAPAWAALAECHVVLMDHGLESPADGWPVVRAAAERAVALDPQLPEAWNALAAYHALARGDAPEAQHATSRALQLNPDLVTAQHWRGVMLVADGRTTEAVTVFRTALAIDPLSPILRLNLGNALSRNGETAEALKELRTVTDLKPEWALARVYLGQALGRAGEVREAARQFKEAAQGDDAAALAYWIGAARQIGDDAQADVAYRRLRGLKGRYVPSYYMALGAWLFGDRDTALRSLSEAINERSPLLGRVAKGDEWRGIESEPRFARVLDLLNASGIHVAAESERR